ncbi:Ubiquitin carboxyl-terminal hydrolase 34 [Bienertia sinuspersici]
MNVEHDDNDRVESHFKVIESQDCEINHAIEYTWNDMVNEETPTVDPGKEMGRINKPKKKKTKSSKFSINEPVANTPSTPIIVKQSVAVRRCSKSEINDGKGPKECFVEHKTEPSLYAKKIPKTTTIRKGLWTGCTKNTIEVDVDISGQQSSLVSASSDANDFEESSDSDGSIVQEVVVPIDERGGVLCVSSVEDDWHPHQWFDFIDDENDDNYFNRLYRNGELYEEKQYGKIVLRPWMIFTDKSHFKDTLKDYCVQEGFTINVLCANSFKYTVICAAECCEWRFDGSMLPDGITWAIKKI